MSPNTLTPCVQKYGAAEMGRIVCVADTGMWVNYVKFYPAAVFPSLVQRRGAVIKDRRLFPPLSVLDEICRGSDEVVAWPDEHKSVFFFAHGRRNRCTRCRDNTHVSASCRFWRRAQPRRSVPDRAGTFHQNGVDNDSLPIIVTEENRESDIKIPKTADKCGVESCSTVGMFERGGWAF